MIKSMTGFGRAKYENEGRQYIVEVKSVNHRYNDINVKLPRNISYMEEKIKKVVSNYVTRGKIDVFVTFNNYSTIGKNIVINKEIAQMYITQLKEIAKETGLEENIPITEISKFPEVLTIQENSDEEVISNELEQCLNQAMVNFVEMREIEGIKIAEDLLKRIDIIFGKIEEITMYSTRLIEEYIVKLETRIKELLKTDVIDETRIAQEVVIYADKSSIEEEITRLKSHIYQLKPLLNSNNATGKKIDFIIQEMNRETNTIGSKSNSLEITKLVVDIKTEIENIREQVQNVE